MGYGDREFSELVGKVMADVRVEKEHPWDGGDRVIFVCDDGTRYALNHEQDCYESVGIEDITGDLADLIGSPILQADEATNSEDPSPSLNPASFTWTFYHLATVKGYVTIRWYGESNGYYSESVSFTKLPATEEAE